MMHFCPFCGEHLGRPVEDAFSSCNNCNRVFDYNFKNKILSAAWLIHKWNLYDIDAVKEKCKLLENELDLVQEIMDNDYIHDEVLKLFEPAPKIS